MCWVLQIYGRLNVDGHVNLRNGLGVEGNTNLSGRLSVGGNVNIVGALSKGSGTFKINHPNPEKSSTHWLYHSFSLNLLHQGIIFIDIELTYMVYNTLFY